MTTPEEQQHRATALDMWTTHGYKLKPSTQVQALTKHITPVDSELKCTWEDVRNNSSALSDCAVHIEEDRSLHTTVYRKPLPSSDQHLVFDSHHQQDKNPVPQSW